MVFPGNRQPLPDHPVYADMPDSRRKWVGRLLVFIILIGLLIGSARLARIDVNRLLTNAPRIAQWVGLMFPPYVDGFRKPPTLEELQNYLQNALETIAIATIGTFTAAVLAIIPASLAARPLTPSLLIYYPVRWFLNVLRAIDSFIFALYFVAAVGLGPFAGVLGVAIHTWGTMAKVYAENLESIELSPMAALEAAGVGRTRAILFGLIPTAFPLLISTTLFWWEFTLRSTIALGIVGAGGIGQDIKNAIDLLNFPHLGVLILIVVVMVTIIDQASNRLRQSLRERA